VSQKLITLAVMISADEELCGLDCRFNQDELSTCVLFDAQLRTTPDTTRHVGYRDIRCAACKAK